MSTCAAWERQRTAGALWGRMQKGKSSSGALQPAVCRQTPKEGLLAQAAAFGRPPPRRRLTLINERVGKPALLPRHRIPPVAAPVNCGEETGAGAGKEGGQACPAEKGGVQSSDPQPTLVCPLLALRCTAALFPHPEMAFPAAGCIPPPPDTSAMSPSRLCAATSCASCGTPAGDRSAGNTPGWPCPAAHADGTPLLLCPMAHTSRRPPRPALSGGSGTTAGA